MTARWWIWVSFLVLLGAGALTWAARTPSYRQPVDVPYTAVAPSRGSLHAAPHYGTRVRFEESFDAACERAAREGKLVLLFHLSGRFDSSETT